MGVIEYYYGAGYLSNMVVFYLLENRFGERKVKIDPKGREYEYLHTNEKKRAMAKETILFKTRIAPWLMGRDDREIPSFKNKGCSKKEFLKQLKGESQNIVVKNEK